MRSKSFICVFLFLSHFLFAQSESTKTKPVGVLLTIDEAFNSSDKVLNSYLGRKVSLGLSYTNKERAYIAFAGVGFKGFKINIYPTTFRDGFINDIKQNYVAVNAISEDNVVAVAMANRSGAGLSGTYSQYIHTGFILNKKFKPAFNFYWGFEEFLLHDAGFRKYEDPVHGDIDYVGMQTVFYEFKLGCTLPFEKFSKKHFCFNVNAGCKLVNYGSMSFNKTPLNAYTAGSLADKYNKSGRFTLSVSFMLWSNWD